MKFIFPTWNSFPRHEIHFPTWNHFLLRHEIIFGDMKFFAATWNHFLGDMKFHRRHEILSPTWNFCGDMKSCSRRHEMVLSPTWDFFWRHEIFIFCKWIHELASVNISTRGRVVKATLLTIATATSWTRRIDSRCWRFGIRSWIVFRGHHVAASNCFGAMLYVFLVTKTDMK